LLIIYTICISFIFGRTTWVKVYDTKYCRGFVIVVGIWRGIPIFGEVKEVIILDGHKVILQYTTLRVLEYITHLNAFKVVSRNEVSYVKQAELVDFHPLGKCKGFGRYTSNDFIALKYKVDCCN